MMLLLFRGVVVVSVTYVPVEHTAFRVGLPESRPNFDECGLWKHSQKHWVLSVAQGGVIPTEAYFIIRVLLWDAKGQTCQSLRYDEVLLCGYPSAIILLQIGHSASPHYTSILSAYILATLTVHRNRVISSSEAHRTAC